MSLRTRLVISFTVLLLVAIVAVGYVASRSTQDILVAQIDRTLLGVAERGPTPEPRPGEGPPGDNQPFGTDAATEDPFLRPTAEIVVGADGSVVLARPSGFADDPDPLPDISGLEDGSGFVYLDSIDGSLRYRALVRAFPDGMHVVLAWPLEEVTSATAELIRALLLAGGGVLLLGAAATWWTVRQSMRPVDEMVDTAEAIAAGDLTRRVPDLDPDTELGRLGLSLNEMLAHLEEAVEVERDAKERLRRFVADASHELRTPLATIAGYAELRSKGGLPTTEDRDKAWSRVESESRRMGLLIEDLLVLARLDQSQPLRMGPVDVAQIVRDAAADHAAIDPRRPVAVASPDVVALEGDEERLTQVVTSLLANVRVHTPEGTETSVSVREDAESVAIEVTDDGPGIPEAALAQVFERFYRADPSRSRTSGGAGLGLAIVRAIVEAHGGTVVAARVATGGTRITVELPKAAPPASQPI
jgi:two-component system OmpR family sensor kinase